MTREELKTAWTATGENLALFEEWPTPPDLQLSAATFLREVGLPSDAAPFLAFSPTAVKSYEAWVLPDGFVPIGSTGSGDPVVLNGKGVVLYLNHNADLAPVYVNTSVETLAEALLAYRQIISEAQRLNGPDAYLDGNVPPELLAGFVSFLEKNDAMALQDRAMWAEELADIVGRRPGGAG